MRALIWLTRRIRRITRGWRMSNCIIFALSLWWLCWLRGQASNGIKVRKSHVKWGILHMLHRRTGRHSGLELLVSYKPDVADKRQIEIIFPGHVERGDRDA